MWLQRSKERGVQNQPGGCHELYLGWGLRIRKNFIKRVTFNLGISGWVTLWGQWRRVGPVCSWKQHNAACVWVNSDWEWFKHSVSWIWRTQAMACSLCERPFFSELFNLQSHLIKICVACPGRLSNHWHCISVHTFAWHYKNVKLSFKTGPDKKPTSAWSYLGALTVGTPRDGIPLLYACISLHPTGLLPTKGRTVLTSHS